MAEDACESWGIGAYSNTPSALHPRRCVSLFSVPIKFFLQGAFQAFWKLGLCSTPNSSHHVFHFGSSSQRMNMWAWVSALYMCPLWCCYFCWIRAYGDPTFFGFFPFWQQHELTFFLSEWKVLGFLWLGGCLREKREGAASYAHVYVCLPACCQASSFTHVTPAKGGATLLMALTN